MTTMPVPKGFVVTSPFGARWGTTHWGTDFGLAGGSSGQPIYAVRDGLITRAGNASGFGKWITLDVDAQHGGGLETVCRPCTVQKGVKPQLTHGIIGQVSDPRRCGNTNEGLTQTLTRSVRAVNQPTQEQWRPVVGYEGHYEVSDQGRVRSLGRVVLRKDGRTCTYPGKLLKPCDNKRPPYFSVNLWKNGKLRRAYVHRLVLEAFVGSCPPGMETCHGTGGSYDNRLENLRWDTPHENSLDTVRHGNNLNSKKTHCKYGHEFTEENTMYSKNGRSRWCKTCNRQRARDWYRQKNTG